uniref:Uncharacterized protein n=1 Tax=Timema shepardi TaxID=629360 RepID=A0A7R9FWW6_TIMSH|nr:unnamed protein product [Timema shepardi]
MRREREENKEENGAPKLLLLTSTSGSLVQALPPSIHLTVTCLLSFTFPSISLSHMSLMVQPAPLMTTAPMPNRINMCGSGNESGGVLMAMPQPHGQNTTTYIAINLRYLKRVNIHLPYFTGKLEPNHGHSTHVNSEHCLSFEFGKKQKRSHGVAWFPVRLYVIPEFKTLRRFGLILEKKKCNVSIIGLGESGDTRDHTFHAEPQGYPSWYATRQNFTRECLRSPVRSRQPRKKSHEVVRSWQNMGREGQTYFRGVRANLLQRGNAPTPWFRRHWYGRILIRNNAFPNELPSTIKNMGFTSISPSRECHPRSSVGNPVALCHNSLVALLVPTDSSQLTSDSQRLDNRDANLALGAYCEKVRGHFDDALNYYSTALELGSYEAGISMIKLKYKKNESCNLIQDFKRMRELFRDDIRKQQELLCMLGSWEYLSNRNAISAIYYWHAAATLDPDARELQEFRSWIYPSKKINIYQAMSLEANYALKKIYNWSDLDLKKPKQQQQRTVQLLQHALELCSNFYKSEQNKRQTNTEKTGKIKDHVTNKIKVPIMKTDEMIIKPDHRCWPKATRPITGQHGKVLMSNVRAPQPIGPAHLGVCGGVGHTTVQVIESRTTLAIVELLATSSTLEAIKCGELGPVESSLPTTIFAMYLPQRGATSKNYLRSTMSPDRLNWFLQWDQRSRDL